MRQIKFRAYGHPDRYDMEPKRMLDWETDVKPMSMAALNRNDFIFMQFTGLLDRNGKEIYEGDIITDYHGDKRVMVYADNGFWCVYPDGEKHLPTQEYREVIGNIHQSPNLLS